MWTRLKCFPFEYDVIFFSGPGDNRNCTPGTSIYKAVSRDDGPFCGDGPALSKFSATVNPPVTEFAERIASLSYYGHRPIYISQVSIPIEVAPVKRSVYWAENGYVSKVHG